MSDLKRGDKVRIEYEGEVLNALTAQSTSHCWDVSVRLPDGTVTYVRQEHVTLIEPAEPEYEVDGIYVAADDKVWRRLEGAQWRLANGYRHVPHNHPMRPLRKLVPEAT